MKYISLTNSVGSGTAQDGSLYANVNIIGVNDGYLNSNELTLVSGRTLTERDQKEARKVVLVSDKLVDNMFASDQDSAIGQPIDVMLSGRYYTYTIVGVYEYEESALSFSSDSDEDVTTDMYLPLKAAQNQTHSTTGYSSFTVVTSTTTDNSTFMDQTEVFFNIYYSRNISSGRWYRSNEYYACIHNRAYKRDRNS